MTGATGVRQAVAGVHVLTSAGLVEGRGHADVARAAVEGRARVVQLRAPELDERQLRPLAVEIAALCRAAGVLFVVNDRVEVALDSGADGVHLGQRDAPARARSRLGPGMLLGVSVETPAQARAAAAAGASYLGVTVWPTPTKPEAAPQGLDGLRAVVAATRLPVIGIGGIDADNAGRVLAAGAAGVAVVSAVGGARDPVAATRALAALVAGAPGRGEEDRDG